VQGDFHPLCGGEVCCCYKAFLCMQCCKQPSLFTAKTIALWPGNVNQIGWDRCHVKKNAVHQQFSVAFEEISFPSGYFVRNVQYLSSLQIWQSNPYISSSLVLQVQRKLFFFHNYGQYTEQVNLSFPVIRLKLFLFFTQSMEN